MPCGGPGLGALSPAASGRGLSQGQPSALGPRVAPPVLRTLAVPSLLGVCLLRLGGGARSVPPRGEGQRAAGRLPVPPWPSRRGPGADRAPQTCASPGRTGSGPGRRGQHRPAVALQTLTFVTGGPTLHPQLTGRSRWRGSVVGGGGPHRPALRVPAMAGVQASPCTQLEPPGAHGLSPVPHPGMGGYPASTGPALRNKETEMTVSSLLEKQPKKKGPSAAVTQAEPEEHGRGRLGREGARLQSQHVIKKDEGPAEFGELGGGRGGPSDVHVVLVLVRLALQRGLLARRLQHLQRRLAQALLPHRGSRLRRQDGRLRRAGGQGSAVAQSPPAPTSPTRGPPRPAITFSFCLVSSEMLPLGESRVGVGGVTVISGGNLVAEEGMTSFGMLGSRRDLARLGSALPGGPSGGGALPPPGTLELATAGRTQRAERGCPRPPRPPLSFAGLITPLPEGQRHPGTASGG